MASERKMLPKLSDTCSKCGTSFKRLVLLAMIVDCGASVHPSPLDCDHDFTEVIRESQ